MYASPGGKLAVLTPPRTASRSVRDCLLKKGWRELNGHHGIDADACHRAKRVGVLVRNHWDTMVSWHVNLSEARSKELSFPEWLELVFAGESTINRWPAVGWGTGVQKGSLWTPWLIWADDVIPFENLVWSLSDFLGEGVEMGHVTDSPVRSRPTCAEAYTPDTAAALHTYFEGEIEALGYEFPVVA